MARALLPSFPDLLRPRSPFHLLAEVVSTSNACAAKTPLQIPYAYPVPRTLKRPLVGLGMGSSRTAWSLAWLWRCIIFWTISTTLAASAWLRDKQSIYIRLSVQILFTILHGRAGINVHSNGWVLYPMWLIPRLRLRTTVIELHRWKLCKPSKGQPWPLFRFCKSYCFTCK